MWFGEWASEGEFFVFLVIRMRIKVSDNHNRVLEKRKVRSYGLTKARKKNRLIAGFSLVRTALKSALPHQLERCGGDDTQRAFTANNHGSLRKLLLPDFEPRNDNGKTAVQVGLLPLNLTCWLDVTQTGLRQDFK